LNKIVPSPQFKRAYKRFIKRNSFLQEKIDESIRTLERNIFDPSLETHKLSGKLLGCFACSCGYDCRIVFEIGKSITQSDNEILLITIGSHDEVY